MKKYSFILLFSFFFMIGNVNAQYYLIPNSFEFDKEASQLNPDFDFNGVNDGQMSTVKTLNGNSNTWYRFEFDLDGSNCAINTDSTACFDTIHAIEDGGLSNTIYGSFQMCVSKPQFHWEVDWSTCSSNCLQKSQDLVIINNSYSNCTLGLYDTETGTNMTNDGYLVDVYFNIAKWQYVEGAYSALVNGRMYLYNDSDSILYYRFVNNSYLSDVNMASINSGFGVFNHDYSQPDVGGETFLNNGTCVMSYNRMNNYNISTWDRENETLTFNNTLPYSRFFDTTNQIKDSCLLGGALTYNDDMYTMTYGASRFSAECNISISPGTYRFDFYDYVGTLGQVALQLHSVNGNFFYINPTHYTNITEEIDWYRIYMINGLPYGTEFKFKNIQLVKGTSHKDYVPYGGYLITYDNIGGDFDIFRWYDTNLNTNGILYFRLTSYSGRTKIGDMVNCPNSRVCRFENELYFSGSFTSLFNSDEQKIKKIEFMLVSSTMSVYFKNPYIYNLEDVPGNATWKSYYQPANVFICSDNDNGTYYNALSKKVYYNPDKPPETFVSNVNSDYQNIFGQAVNFYGLTDILNFPIQIITKINNGEYRNCTPLEVPFPGFPNKTLTLPCFSTFLWNKFPTMRDMYNVIIMGYISLQVAKGTINYIKKWYLGTVESEDL